MDVRTDHHAAMHFLRQKGHIVNTYSAAASDYRIDDIAVSGVGLMIIAQTYVDEWSEYAINAYIEQFIEAQASHKPN